MVTAYDMGMKQTFLKGNDDILWLRKTHLPENAPIFRCAVLHGSEDCPKRVELYAHNNINALVGVYVDDPDGVRMVPEVTP